MTTLETVGKIIAELKDISPDDITENTSFSDLALDSLDIVEISMACEEEFDITLDVETPPKTVGEFVQMIEELVTD